jgi:hypothetical protein
LRARIAHRSTLFVSRVALETALGAIFVDLCRYYVVAVRHCEDFSFFATFQTTVDFADDAFGEERFETACHVIARETPLPFE